MIPPAEWTSHGDTAVALQELRKTTEFQIISGMIGSLLHLAELGKMSLMIIVGKKDAEGHMHILSHRPPGISEHLHGTIEDCYRKVLLPSDSLDSAMHDEEVTSRCTRGTQQPKPEHIEDDDSDEESEVDEDEIVKLEEELAHDDLEGQRQTAICIADLRSPSTEELDVFGDALDGDYEGNCVEDAAAAPPGERRAPVGDDVTYAAAKSVSPARIGVTDHEDHTEGANKDALTDQPMVIARGQDSGSLPDKENRPEAPTSSRRCFPRQAKKGYINAAEESPVSILGKRKEDVIQPSGVVAPRKRPKVPELPPADILEDLPAEYARARGLPPFSLKYNPRYKILVCTRCEYAVPAAGLKSHMTEKNKKFNRRHEDYDPSRDSKDIQSLSDAYILKTALEMPKTPRGDQVGPVAGLQVRSGYACTLCNYAAEKQSALEKHVSTKHQDRDGTASNFVRAAQVQTFVINAKLFFEVKGEVRLQTAWDSGPLDGSDIAARLQKRTDDELGEAVLHSHPLYRRDVLPFLDESGFTTRMKDYNFAELTKLVQMPKNDKFKKARVCALEYSLNYFEELEKTHTSLRQRLRSCVPGRLDLRPLKAPIHFESRVRYAKEACRMLNMLFQCIDQDGDSDPAKHHFDLYLDDNQRERAHLLRKNLRESSRDSKEHTQDLYHDLLLSCVVPENICSHFKNPLHNPLLAFLCLRILRPEGGIISVEQIPPLLAKIQSLIRGVLQTEIMKHAPEDDCPSAEFEKWWLFAETYLDRWLTETRVSPFATIRNWMHALTKVVRSSSGPPIVSWPCENTLLIREHTLHIQRWYDMLRSSMNELTAFVKTEILFDRVLSVPYPQKYSLPPDGTEKSIGYGTFAPQDGKRFTPASEAFLEILLEVGMVKIHEGGETTWDETKAILWMSRVTVAKEMAFRLKHVLAGLPPRGTEEVLLQLVNTEAADRHVYLYPGPDGLPPLVKFLTKYNKCVGNAGVWFLVTRIIPLELSQIFWTLIDVVRPVETSIASDILARTKDDKLAIQALYSSRMWISDGKIWTPERLSSILSAWFQKELGFDMGLRTYRQFSKAWQNKKLIPHTPDTSRQQAADSVAGHGSATAALHYGLRKEDHGQPQHKSEAQSSICLEWHVSHKFSSFAVDPLL